MILFDVEVYPDHNVDAGTFKGLFLPLRCMSNAELYLRRVVRHRRRFADSQCYCSRSESTMACVYETYETKHGSFMM